MSSTSQCKNCEKHFEQSFNYCPFCGQKSEDKLTIGVLFSNTISNYFSIDARFFKSFIPLMTKPGALARQFVDGKRLTYLHPAQFYLFISVVFFFAFSFSVREADTAVTKALKKGFNKEIALDSLQVQKDSIAQEITENVLNDSIIRSKLSENNLSVIDSVIKATEKEGPDVSFTFKRKTLDSLIANQATEEEKLKFLGLDEKDGAFTRKFYAQALKIYENKGGGILKTLYDTIPITMFLMLPLFAFILKLFYWKRGAFAHHMVFSFYFFTFLFTSFCVLILTNAIIDIPVWIEVLVFLSFIVYLMIAFRNFYRSSWIGAFFKAGLVSYVYMMIIVPIAFFGVVMVSFMLY